MKKNYTTLISSYSSIVRFSFLAEDFVFDSISDLIVILALARISSILEWCTHKSNAIFLADICCQWYSYVRKVSKIKSYKSDLSSGRKYLSILRIDSIS